MIEISKNLMKEIEDNTITYIDLMQIVWAFNYQRNVKPKYKLIISRGGDKKTDERRIEGVGKRYDDALWIHESSKQKVMKTSKGNKNYYVSLSTFIDNKGDVFV